MATKPGRVVTYNKEFPSLNSRPFITWKVSDFDFSCMICKIRTQKPISSPTSCCIKRNVFWEYFELYFGTEVTFHVCEFLTSTQKTLIDGLFLCILS